MLRVLFLGLAVFQAWSVNFMLFAQYGGRCLEMHDIPRIVFFPDRVGPIGWVFHYGGVNLLRTDFGSEACVVGVMRTLHICLCGYHSCFEIFREHLWVRVV